MDVVFKYLLPSQGHKALQLPVGADILAIANQHERVSLWARVDQHEKETETRDFYVAVTGEPLKPINCQLVFLETVLLHQGEYVAHVFEVKK